MRESGGSSTGHNRETTGRANDYPFTEGRSPAPPPLTEIVCAENNRYVVIGNDTYLQSADGYLMPARKGQAPPDLSYFRKTPK